VKHRAIAAVVVVALIAAVVTCEMRLGSISRDDPLGRQLLYLPTPEILEVLSLGNRGLVADLLYLWAIQYYSQFRLQEKFLYLETVFNLITDLDPFYSDAYRIGAMIMSIQRHGDPEQRKQAVVRLYDKGLANRPDDWELAEVAAWDAYLVLRDRELAIRWAKMASERPGARPRVKRMYARWKDTTDAWSVEDSIEYWEDVLATSTRIADVQFAKSHLYDAHARRDRQLLDPLLARYWRRTGRCPNDWRELVDAGMLPQPPLDYVGNVYRIDRESCTTDPYKRIPWKILVPRKEN
jgi:tetratricopeptide (TPR) repeat protein